MQASHRRADVTSPPSPLEISEEFRQVKKSSLSIRYFSSCLADICNNAVPLPLSQPAPDQVKKFFLIVGRQRIDRVHKFVKR